jgi:molybdate transport system permease protein
MYLLGLLLAGLFVAFEVLPLVAVCVRAPLRMLKVAQCCQIVRQAMFLSLATSLTTTALVFIIGTPVAYTIAMNEFRGKRVLEVLIELPLTLPPVVAGVALLLAFGRNGYLGKHLSLLGFDLSFTQGAVIMAQFMVASPYYVKAAISAFQMVPTNLLLASRTLGAGPIRTLFTVLLPVCRNGLLAGLALTWARAVGEFGATIMFAGNFPGRTQTMPLAVLTTMQQDLHAGFVLSAMMLAMCLSVFVIVRLLLQSSPEKGTDLTLHG